jgi:hypothetical protein
MEKEMNGVVRQGHKSGEAGVHQQVGVGIVFVFFFLGGGVFSLCFNKIKRKEFFNY